MGPVTELVLILMLFILPIAAVVSIFVRLVLMRRKRAKSIKEFVLNKKPDVTYNKKLSEEERKEVDRKSLSLSFVAKQTSSALAGAMLFFAIAKIVGAEFGILGKGLLFGVGAALGVAACEIAKYLSMREKDV